MLTAYLIVLFQLDDIDAKDMCSLKVLDTF